MSLHLMKLCVGCASIEEFVAWIDLTLAQKRAAGEKAEQTHTTRMVPKRIDELLDGGSLYWVIKGNIQCRQKLLDIRPYKDNEGINRCRFVLDPEVVPTVWQPRRAFQGWRYFNMEDVPADRNSNAQSGLPAMLHQELADLGLL